MKIQDLIENVVRIAEKAGNDILTIYNNGNFNSWLKRDASPLTEADLQSHRVITGFLARLTPHMPILSEESSKIDYKIRKNWTKFWLIDPLDGTKEFIKRNGEFTVNIALIEKGKPLLGVVHAPAIEVTYWTDGSTAFKRSNNKDAVRIKAAETIEKGDLLKVVISRSHSSEELQQYLNRLPKHECMPMGSSLKFCLVAEGLAHLYPRIGPTMEWDTAAAHAIVKTAGGSVKNLHGNELVYNKKSLYNPLFLVTGIKDLKVLKVLFDSLI